MAQVKEILTQVDALSAQINELKLRKKHLLTSAQEKCKHPLLSLREAPYKKGILYTARPFRVCIECGLREEGWGCGYKKLAPSIYSGVAQLSREAAQNLVRY